MRASRRITITSKADSCMAVRFVCCSSSASRSARNRRWFCFTKSTALMKRFPIPYSVGGILVFVKKVLSSVTV